NADTCYQTITVEDTTPPEITCPSDLTFECDAVGDFGFPTATDLCDPNPAISEISRDSTVGDCDWVYTLVIGYEAIDGCGNADTCYQTITVEDTTPPEITCPSDKTFECDNVGDFGFPTATDLCDPNPAISEISRDSTAGCEGTYTLLIGYEAADGCDNADTCYQLITVIDTTPPSITCPPDAVFDCVMGDPGVPSVWDNCDPNPDVDYNDVTTNPSCPLVIERTWTATDDCGNSNSCTQTITVQDTIPPVITCAADETIACDETVVFTPPTATDNCDPNPTITMVYTDIPDGPGIYKRGWIATDLCNNESDTCYQTITVEPCPCTFTIGGWGAECPGPDPELQPGCIRDNYWDIVFGNDSVMIGNVDGFTAKWSSSLAVENFLPSGTTPGVLDQDYVNPLSTSAGVLASQILALRLNVEYSCAGIFTILGFPSAGDCYGDALVPESCANGLFNGYTIYEFLALADSVVAGINTDYTSSQVNYAATCLNQFESDCDPYAPATASIESNNTSGSARPSTGGEIPTVFSLGQNYPNPFNPITEFEFGIPVASHVTLEIFNIMGQKVTTLVNDYHKPGMYNVIWNGSNAASGIYFYRIEAGDYIETRKMLLLK
ncbi:MAG: T9SS type A sorting domain-containing protein, partial [Candidatus Zixiibacteriota bacterium]